MSPEGIEKDELRARFTRWIMVTAQNAQKNYLKKERRCLNTVSLDSVAEESFAIEDAVQVSAFGESDSFDFMEEALAAAFRELPLMRRRILELLFVEELTPTEIAQHLHCSVQHVYNQRSLALKRLRERLLKDGE